MYALSMDIVTTIKQQCIIEFMIVFWRIVYQFSIYQEMLRVPLLIGYSQDETIMKGHE